MTIERAKEILAEHKKYAEEWAESYRDLTGNRDEWQEENVQAHNGVGKDGGRGGKCLKSDLRT